MKEVHCVLSGLKSETSQNCFSRAEYVVMKMRFSLIEDKKPGLCGPAKGRSHAVSRGVKTCIGAVQYTGKFLADNIQNRTTVFPFRLNCFQGCELFCL